MSRYQDELNIPSINGITIFDLFSSQKGGFMELIHPEKQVGFVHVGPFIIDVMLRTIKQKEKFTFEELFDKILDVSYSICDVKHYGSSAIERSFSYIVRSHLSYNYSEIPLPGKLNPTITSFSRELWNVLTIRDSNELEIVGRMVEKKMTRIPSLKNEKTFFWEFTHGEEI